MKESPAVRVNRMCKKVRDLRDATRIWNAIDNLDDPDPLWTIMRIRVPWAFRNRLNANTIIFTY